MRLKTNVHKCLFLQDLSTNNRESKRFQSELEHNFCKPTFSASSDDDDDDDINNTSNNNNGEQLSGVKVSRGQDFGEFNLGSTIVLIFEAPPNFHFNIHQNEKVLYGGQLGSVEDSTYL